MPHILSNLLQLRQQTISMAVLLSRLKQSENKVPACKRIKYTQFVYKSISQYLILCSLLEKVDTVSRYLDFSNSLLKIDYEVGGIKSYLGIIWGSYSNMLKTLTCICLYEFDSILSIISISLASLWPFFCPEIIVLPQSPFCLFPHQNAFTTLPSFILWSLLFVIRPSDKLQKWFMIAQITLNQEFVNLQYVTYKPTHLSLRLIVKASSPLFFGQKYWKCIFSCYKGKNEMLTSFCVCCWIQWSKQNKTKTKTKTKQKQNKQINKINKQKTPRKEMVIAKKLVTYSRTPKWLLNPTCQH